MSKIKDMREDLALIDKDAGPPVQYGRSRTKPSTRADRMLKLLGRLTDAKIAYAAEARRVARGVS